jgi:hypothetical protein
MKPKRRDGGPAFAYASAYAHHEGMTLRQYYFGQIMQGAVSRIYLDKENMALATKWALSVVDAMLIEEAKEEK